MTPLLRGIRNALLIEAAAAAAALAVWAGVAHAAPPTADAQVVADQTAEWIGRQLRVPPPYRRWEVIPRTQMNAGAAAQAPFERPVIQTTPDVVRWVADLRRHRLGGAALHGTGRLVLHELLHRPRDPGDYRDQDRVIEEGVVEAVAVDLHPAWTNRFTGWGPITIAPIPAYRPWVAAIRAASRYATHSRSWRDRRARLWRRQLLLADTTTRRVMLQAAEARRP